MAPSQSNNTFLQRIFCIALCVISFPDFQLIFQCNIWIWNQCETHDIFYKYHFDNAFFLAVNTIQLNYLCRRVIIKTKIIFLWFWLSVAFYFFPNIPFYLKFENLRYWTFMKNNSLNISWTWFLIWRVIWVRIVLISILYLRLSPLNSAEL